VKGCEGMAEWADVLVLGKVSDKFGVTFLQLSLHPLVSIMPTLIIVSDTLVAKVIPLTLFAK